MTNKFKWDLEDQITDETLIVYNGTIRQNGKVKQEVKIS